MSPLGTEVKWPRAQPTNFPAKAVIPERLLPTPQKWRHHHHLLHTQMPCLPCTVAHTAMQPCSRRMPCLTAQARLKREACVPTVNRPTMSEAALELVRWPTTGHWLHNSVDMAAACGCTPLTGKVLADHTCKHACCWDAQAASWSTRTWLLLAGRRWETPAASCCLHRNGAGVQEATALAAAPLLLWWPASRCCGGLRPAAVVACVPLLWWPASRCCGGLRPAAWLQWVSPCLTFCMLTPHMPSSGLDVGAAASSYYTAACVLFLLLLLLLFPLSLPLSLLPLVQ